MPENQSIAQFNKELTILAHVEAIHKLLENDTALAESIGEKIESLKIGKRIRNVLMVNRKKLSYYNEKCALELAPILDEVIETRKPKEFKLADHPGMSVRTIYLRVYQSWSWLIDNHEKKEQYAILKRDTRLTDRPNVRIYFKSSEALVPSDINVKMDGFVKTQNKINDFLALDIKEDTMFDERDLSLTTEQMEDVKNSLMGLPEDKIKIIIDPTRIRILRRV